MARRKKKTAKNKNGTDDISYIWPQLRQFAVPLKSLNLDPKNANKHNADNLRDIEISLDEHGQWQPVIVQKQGMVVRIGNGRCIAAKRLGWDYIAAVIVDKDDVEAVAMAIIDNRSAEKSTWDYDQLGELLTWLHEKHDYNIQKVGFKREELDAIVLNSMWDGVPDEKVGGGKEPDLSSIIKVRVESGFDMDEVRETLRRYCRKKWGEKVEVV